MIEVRCRFGVLSFCLSVGVSNRDQLQVSRPIGITVATGTVHCIPVAFHGFLGRLIAKVAEKSVHIIVLRHPIPGLDTPATWDPHRWMRLLYGTRPHVDVAELIELPVKG